MSTAKYHVCPMQSYIIIKQIHDFIKEPTIVDVMKYETDS